MKILRFALATTLLLPLGAAPVPLAGVWRFELDPKDLGEQEKWAGRDLAGTMRLPGTTDQAGLGEPTSETRMNILNRAHRYVGPAWYQRDIVVPPQWNGSKTELFLERVLWQSKVWVDGNFVGAADSTHTPHTHSLGGLAPGKHRLTIRVDNRMIHPIGDWGHIYTEQTQSIWNGITGRIEIRQRPPTALGLLRVFADAATKEVRVEAEVTGDADAVAVILRELPHGRVVGRATGKVDGPNTQVTVPFRAAPKVWDEFRPSLYSAEVVLSAGKHRDRKETVFGFRDVRREGRRILVNGRRVFLRGNLDNAMFPLTGAPPTDIASWKKLFKVYKDHGMNHVRFHTYTPPEAAFHAADEMGIYIQAEILWIDEWMGGVHPVLGTTAGSPKGVGVRDRSIDDFVRAEMRRVLDAYGNHPSFLLFCIGNELGSSNFEEMGRWLAEEKERDPRRLYSASTARALSPADDYTVTHSLPHIGRTRGRVESGTDWDYSDTYGKATLPVIAHEIGQWPVYPVWSEIEKYKGVLKARNLETLRDQARKSGLFEQDKELQAASGASSLLMYKYEAESFLRTPDCSGVQFLGVQDYPGQGEALVGWLDAFYESKGLITPMQVRRWYGPTVPLARLEKFVWTNAEKLSARIEIAHYGPDDLLGAKPTWKLAYASGDVLAEGALSAVDLTAGATTAAGTFAVPLDAVQKPQKLTLTVSLPGTAFENDWPVFVFPANTSEPDAGDILLTADLDTALSALARGGKVLLLANELGGKQQAKQAAWQPLYWSSAFMPNQSRDTLGAIVSAAHPALADFPTEKFLDWQWRGLATNARGFDLVALPATFRPIVQPVSDFHFNRKLGSIFELKAPGGGRLMVCGYNLGAAGNRSPEARQLLASLLTYMRGVAFQPAQQASPETLRRILSDN